MHNIEGLKSYKKVPRVVAFVVARDSTYWIIALDCTLWIGPIQINNLLGRYAKSSFHLFQVLLTPTSSGLPPPNHGRTRSSPSELTGYEGNQEPIFGRIRKSALQLKKYLFRIQIIMGDHICQLGMINSIFKTVHNNSQIMTILGQSH